LNQHYNKSLKLYARELRTESVSRAEKYIWKALLSRRQLGVLVKRQRPIYNFIVDFFIPELNLVIEIDGSSHLNKGDYDRYREDKLISLGYTLIRFSEGDVLNNLDEVANSVRYTIDCLKDS
jgi:very-short-patch-repair endonuclease